MTSNQDFDPTTLKKIEGDWLNNHHHLTELDECYFFDEYPTAEGFNHPGYSRIINFKRSLDAKPNLLKYKNREIEYYANLMRNATQKSEPPLPIIIAPTSKSPQDPLYDERLLKTLSKARDKGGKIIPIDLFETTATRSALHHNGGQTRSIQEIKDSIICKADALQFIADSNFRKIFFFDDMITTGCTFHACRQKINECLCQITNTLPPDFLGIFLSRRVPPNPADEFDADDPF